MNWIICAIGAIMIFIIVIALTMYFIVRKSSQISRSSKYILNRFEPDNTAPKITELIEFDKGNKVVKYIVD